mmetsp:Transcript_28529/g.57080  ORF Transcript_28529/g.57080 Transcript_28529/m.57080 type:complete len:217 (-) Transcript_28529:1152-1802(-)
MIPARPRRKHSKVILLAPAPCFTPRALTASENTVSARPVADPTPARRERSRTNLLKALEDIDAEAAPFFRDSPPQWERKRSQALVSASGATANGGGQVRNLPLGSMSWRKVPTARRGVCEDAEPGEGHISPEQASAAQKPPESQTGRGSLGVVKEAERKQPRSLETGSKRVMPISLQTRTQLCSSMTRTPPPSAAPSDEKVRFLPVPAPPTCWFRE